MRRSEPSTTQSLLLQAMMHEVSYGQKCIRSPTKNLQANACYSGNPAADFDISLRRSRTPVAVQT